MLKVISEKSYRREPRWLIFLLLLIQGILTTLSQSNGGYKYDYATVPFLAEVFKVLLMMQFSCNSVVMILKRPGIQYDSAIVWLPDIHYSWVAAIDCVIFSSLNLSFLYLVSSSGKSVNLHRPQVWLQSGRAFVCFQFLLSSILSTTTFSLQLWPMWIRQHTR